MTGVSRLPIGWFPKALGLVLVGGGVAYLVDLLAAFLVPNVGQAIHAFASILPAIAEISMVGYLLVKGVQVPALGSPIAMTLPGAPA